MSRAIGAAHGAEAGLTIQVRLFASLREHAGWDARRLALVAGTTPERVWRELGLGGGAIPATVRVAVNQAFASPHQPLAPGDELAFLPPISGG